MASLAASREQCERTQKVSVGRSGTSGGGAGHVWRWDGWNENIPGDAEIADQRAWENSEDSTDTCPSPSPIICRPALDR